MMRLVMAGKIVVFFDFFRCLDLLVSRYSHARVLTGLLVAR